MDVLTREIGGEEPGIDEDDTGEPEADLPPEYCHYRDEGCELAPACLDCPFPQCLFEKPRGKQRWVKGQRNGEIAGLFATGRWGVGDLARLFGISRRTVQRALKSTLPVPSGKAGTGAKNGETG